MPTYIDLLKAGLTPVIALVTAYIAWQQWRTNRNQFRLHLFDRRLAVYNSAMGFAVQAVSTGDVKPEDLTRFFQSTREANFLFDAQIEKYCEELYEKGREIMVSKPEQEPSSEEHQKSVERRGETLKWFNAQIRHQMPKKFARFLRIRE